MSGIFRGIRTCLAVVAGAALVAACANTQTPTGTSPVAATTAATTAVKGGNNTAVVCHLQDNGAFAALSINPSAVPAHLRHGDGQPAGAVPGQPGATFGWDCEVLLLGAEATVRYDRDCFDLETAAILTNQIGPGCRNPTTPAEYDLYFLYNADTASPERLAWNGNSADLAYIDKSYGTVTAADIPDASAFCDVLSSSDPACQPTSIYDSPIGTRTAIIKTAAGNFFKVGLAIDNWPTVSFWYAKLQ